MRNLATRSSARENGREALAALATDVFDLVLMDVQMPEMDGFEATQAIRAREQTNGSRLPIVALTTHAMKEDRERCLATGMDAYLSKPIQSAELFATIEQMVSQPEQGHAPCSPRQSATSALDAESLRSRVGENPALLLDLVTVFQHDSQRLLQELRNGVSRRDPGVVERAAHRLKGSLATLARAT